MTASAATEEHDDLVGVLARAEPALRQVLVAHCGIGVGVDLTAGVLAWAWSHPQRVVDAEPPLRCLVRAAPALARRHGYRKGRAPDFAEAIPEPADAREWATQRALRTAAALDPQCRVAALLVAGHGWTEADAAEAMGLDPTFVAEHVAEARDRLGTEVEDVDAAFADAGRALDAWAIQRVAERAAAAPRSEPRLSLAVGLAVLVVLALGAGIVAMTRSAETRQEVEARLASTTTTTPLSLSEQATRLGLTGQIVTSEEGLVDLETGEATPLVAPADPDDQVSTPTAVLDGDDGLYYLSDPDDAGPALRHLRADRSDEVVEEGVTSYALRPDGTLALAMDDQVVVEAPDGTRTTWTTEGGFHVRAWAGDRLLAERDLDDGDRRDAVVLDGPSQVRVLAHAGSVLAVGDDTEWVMVSGVAPGESAPDDDAPAPPARVVDIVSGAVGGSADLGPEARTPTVVRLENGLVGATTTVDGRPAVVLLRIAHRRTGVPDISRAALMPLDETTTVPTSVRRSPDGKILALARDAAGSDAGMVLWSCVQGGGGCLRAGLASADGGYAELVADPRRS